MIAGWHRPDEFLHLCQKAGKEALLEEGQFLAEVDVAVEEDPAIAWMIVLSPEAPEALVVKVRYAFGVAT